DRLQQDRFFLFSLNEFLRPDRIGTLPVDIESLGKVLSDTLVIEDQRSIAVERHAWLTPVVTSDKDAPTVNDHAFCMMIVDLTEPLGDVHASRFEEPRRMCRCREP